MDKARIEARIIGLAREFAEQQPSADVNAFLSSAAFFKGRLEILFAFLDGMKGGEA